MSDLGRIEKAKLIVEAALEMKAEDPVVLDMSRVSSFADTFIILTGRSDRHAHSVADAIIHTLRAADEEPLGVEGMNESHWILIDGNDAVVHVFEAQTREVFAIERLWSDAPIIDLVRDLGVPREAMDGLAESSTSAAS